LVEAKAHLPEFFSSPTQAGPASKAKVEEAFSLVQTDLNIRSLADWTGAFYQYANRIAFLWWLRKNNIAAELVFVSFLNDSEMRGPSHAETWEAVFASADYVLGLKRNHSLKKHIHHMMPDVRHIN
jgi:hypothetical protein